MEPRQPLLAGEIGERIGARTAELELEAAALRTQRLRADFAPVLIDDGATRLGAAKRGAGVLPARASVGGYDFFVSTLPSDGNAPDEHKLRHAVAVYAAATGCGSAYLCASQDATIAGTRPGRP